MDIGSELCGGLRLIGDDTAHREASTFELPCKIRRTVTAREVEDRAVPGIVSFADMLGKTRRIPTCYLHICEAGRPCRLRRLQAHGKDGKTTDFRQPASA